MSAYPAHTKRRQPTLANMMANSKTNPAKIQALLSRYFDQCRVMWTKGAPPFQFALECLDSRDAVRLLILFFWRNDEGWTYQPVSRKGAKRVRLESPT